VLTDVLDTLDAAAVRSWCAVGLARLRDHQHEIDNLNVYPVPDGDTGTNLVLTMTAAGEAIAAEPGEPVPAAPGEPVPAAPAAPGEPDAHITDLGVVLRCLARGALLGARGNSGVILSQIFTGIAEVLADVPAADGKALAAALDRAAESARHAVAAPVEGTILTVVRAAADAALSASGGGDDLAAVVQAAAEAARAALARTPEQLPALARAGVVDAGGRGLVVLLDALVEVVTGDAPAGAEPPVPAAAPPRRAAVAAMRETGSDEYGYEVQYLLDAPDEAVDRLRATLTGLGDSLVIVGARGPDPAQRTWNVHVHVNDVGAALEAGVEAGRPHRISVTRFVDQMPPAPPTGLVASPDREPHPEPPPVTEPFQDLGSVPGESVAEAAGVGAWAGDSDRPEPAVPRPHARAVVVVCDGDDMAGLFAAEGAEVVRRHPDGAAPSTGEILDAVRATGAGRVVILPNDPNVTAAAAAAAAEARSALVRAGVVPTRSPVQGLAALAVRDPGRRFEDDIIAMAEAAGACRYAEVTTASREALTVAGRCQPGDVLALIQGEVSLIGQDLLGTCEELLDRLLGAGGEMVTLLTGDQAPPWLADRLIDHVRRSWPFVEVHCYRGGQPHYPLLVGVE
jgi:DAK2 domain fusion protein YloV